MLIYSYMYVFFFKEKKTNRFVSMYLIKRDIIYLLRKFKK